MKTIYLSTSTLENAVQILLNAGCFERRDDALDAAQKRFEHVFRIQVLFDAHGG